MWGGHHAILRPTYESHPEGDQRGDRAQEWDTRAGTVGVAIPELRARPYSPDWYVERGRRAGRALTHEQPGLTHPLQPV